MKKLFLCTALVAFFVVLCIRSECGAQGAYLELGTVKKYAKTVVVCPVGTSAENGMILLDTVGSISDADYDNPYLVKLEPGVYNVSDTSLEMKPYVDIEGSGTGTTRIEGEIGAIDRGIIVGADNAEIRFLSIENLGSLSSNAIGVYCDGTSPRLFNVSVTARNGNNNCHAVSCFSSSAPQLENVRLEAHDATNYVIGLYAHASEPKIQHSEIWVSGGAFIFGVETEMSSAALLNDVDIEADGTSAYGIYNETNSTVDIYHSYIVGQYAVFTTGVGSGGGDIRIESSTIIGLSSSVRNDNSTGAKLLVGASRIEGPVSSGVSCAHVHDGDYIMLDASCN